MSVFGHFMGAHRALICALKNPGKYKAYDATCLVKSYPGSQLNIIDQGKDDEFLSDGQLLPDNVIAASSEKKSPVVFRLPEGYDHSYYFIATFIADHIRYHAKYLNS